MACEQVASEGPSRKLPALEPDTAFFWTSGAEGVLRIQRCQDCGHWQHPPLQLCPKCHSDAVTPAETSGLGRVLTWTVNHQAWLPGVDPRFVFAAIELDEQDELYVFSNVLAPPEAVHKGVRVEVCFEQCEDVWIPLFRPLEEATA